MNPLITRDINENESIFLNSSNNSKTQISSKISKNYLVFHSKLSKKYTKTCSNVIKYAISEVDFGFAEIKYYFNLMNKIFACINEFEVTENDFFFMYMEIIIHNK